MLKLSLKKILDKFVLLSEIVDLVVNPEARYCRVKKWLPDTVFGFSAALNSLLWELDTPFAHQAQLIITLELIDKFEKMLNRLILEWGTQTVWNSFDCHIWANQLTEILDAKAALQKGEMSPAIAFAGLERIFIMLSYPGKNPSLKEYNWSQIDDVFTS